MTKIVKLDFVDDNQLAELPQVTCVLFSRLLITSRLREGHRIDLPV